MASEESAEEPQHDWLLLERLWTDVLTDDEVLGIETGGWHVSLRCSRNGQTPATDEADQIAIHAVTGHGKHEVGRWGLEEVQGS